MIEMLLGDCLERLRDLPDCSVDACVTDPPYGLSFMGKAWDYDVPQVDVWREVLRVLKPGGHLLAFAGTRTQHRMAVQIEDAGFEIRDLIAWVYGSGFPKSRNLDGDWQGWGTALKPALEPITVARKPFKGTVAANVLEHGTGALNINGCRIGETAETWPKSRSYHSARGPKPRAAHGTGDGETISTGEGPAGRWPANLIHDGSDEVVGLFPHTAPSKASMRGVGLTGADEKVYGKGDPTFDTMRGHNDAGGSAARFFYCAKASKADRGEGNSHPTVKPTELMRYLCRLVTPPGGVVLDPFMGSGSTGKAAVLEGFRFIGIEREAEYLEIARGRIEVPAQGSLL
jgi:site-specific DNA-methyltransferase (adenine-specific)